jgi:hypothetical protein
MANDLVVPVELTDAELDAVTGGQGPNVAVGSVLSNISVDVDVALNNVLNNVASHDNIAVAVLGAIGPQIQ